MIPTFVHKYLGQFSLSKVSLLNVILCLGGVTLLVIFICAPIMYWSESQVDGSNVTAFDDAVWLSFMIVTTIGFGDFYPVSTLGRFVTVILAATGIGVFGTLAGYFGSLIMDRVVRQATTDMLHDQNLRIEALAQQNQDLVKAIKEIADENKKLNEFIVELSETNALLNKKIERDTDEILSALKNR